MRFHVLILGTIFATCASLPVEEKDKVCAHGILNPACLKLGAISLIERLNLKDEVSLFPGISLVKDLNRSVSDSEKVLKGQDNLDKHLLYHVGNFLDTHSLKFKLLDNEAVEEAKGSLGEARAKRLGGSKKGGMGGLIALAMMMKGTMMSIGIGALALLAGKALMTAVMSLLLSAIIGIKSLTSGQKSTTYEIVSKPIYTHSHSHSTAHEDVGGGYGHSGYGRNLNVRKR